MKTLLFNIALLLIVGSILAITLLLPYTIKVVSKAMREKKSKLFSFNKIPFISKAHASRTIADDPLQKYKFRVTIAGLPTGLGFQKVGGLSREVGVVEYMEGLFDHTHKLPGKEKVGEVTFERGTYASKDLEQLYEKTLKDQNMRTTVTISMMNKFGEVAKSWNLAEAWASKWESSDLDASSDDVAIEKITMQFEYFL
jgi:phage tail-like protein